MSFVEIKNLIKAEQKRQQNRFIETDDLNSYLLKIQIDAEFITHYIAGKCAGFIAFYCNDEAKELAFITLVLLAPEFRGRGVANNLINCTLKYCKEKGFKNCELQVRKDNFSAIRLYKKFGFIIKSHNDDKIKMSVIL